MRSLIFISLTAILLLTSPFVSAQIVVESLPEAKVRSLPVDENRLYGRDYRRIYGDLPIYSAPNGEQVGYMGGGYIYVTVHDEHNGWSRIGENQWVRSEILSGRIYPSRFAGALLPTETELDNPVAWTLHHLHGSKTPGGPEAEDNPFLYRYTLVTIFETVEVDDYQWYRIGDEQWVHQFKLAKVLPVEKPAEIENEKWISVDLYEQVAIAYEEDTPVFATLISSGLEEWPTNEGIFEVYVRYTATVMSGGGYDDYYYLQDVPHSMYFDGGIALHGAYWHDGFGFRQSHGCVNISLTDAFWFYNWMQSEYDYDAGDYTGAAIYVHSSGEYD